MMRELDADHAYLAASALALFASSFLLIELLRDWLDPRSFVHKIATVLVALSAAPAMLLPPDHSRHSETDAGVSLFAMYEIARWSMLALFFVVAPATLTFAGASRRDVRNQACCAAGAGLLLCIALSLVTPLITLWIPDSGKALNLPSGQWASDLFAWQRSGAPVVPGGGNVIPGSSSAPQDKVPRALLDGPLAFALLAGACLLATHGANGAVALPRLLWPLLLSRPERRSPPIPPSPDMPRLIRPLPRAAPPSRDATASRDSGATSPKSAIFATQRASSSTCDEGGEDDDGERERTWWGWCPRRRERRRE